MRPMARRLAQHGGPPGWLEESDPGRCDFIRDGCAVTFCLFSTVPVALTRMLSCELMEFPAAVVIQ
jgi:hypothetical protein